MNSFVTLIDSMGNDLTVVNSARVSMNKCSGLFDDVKDTRLIQYLAEHNHWTPFASVIIQMRFKMPIFVARQWFRSTIGLTRNEVSRRYVDDKPEFWYPTSWRARAEHVKQGSGDNLPRDTQDKLFTGYDDFCDRAESYYNFLLDNNVCPEQARAVLPQATMTEFIETGSLAAYARVYQLRSDGHAQKEIREYASAISEIVSGIAPISWNALLRYGK